MSVVLSLEKFPTLSAEREIIANASICYVCNVFILFSLFLFFYYLFILSDYIAKLSVITLFAKSFTCVSSLRLIRHLLTPNLLSSLTYSKITNKFREPQISEDLLSTKITTFSFRTHIQIRINIQVIAHKKIEKHCPLLQNLSL